MNSCVTCGYGGETYVMIQCFIWVNHEIKTEGQIAVPIGQAGNTISPLLFSELQFYMLVLFVMCQILQDYCQINQVSQLHEQLRMCLVRQGCCLCNYILSTRLWLPIIYSSTSPATLYNHLQFQPKSNFGSGLDKHKHSISKHME